MHQLGKALCVVCLLLATATIAAAECEWNVTVDWCCNGSYSAGWFYNTTDENWTYAIGPWDAAAVWFRLNISGEPFYGYCKDFDINVTRNASFNATIIPAEPSCKNNSFAYVLNTWTQSCADCENVSAGQAAFWYFWYSDAASCRTGIPFYNHTARPTEPGWESRWIPDCAVHPEACTMINASINKSVPYKLALTPSSGTYPPGTPVELEAVVQFCAGTDPDEVTVRFETEPGCALIESGTDVVAVMTSGGIARATLWCEPSVAHATVSATINDAYWFELIIPCDDHQGLIRVVNIPPDNAAFRFVSAPQVPALSRAAALILTIALLAVALTTMKRRTRES
ncbi:MAG TPA: hypothetical protein ENN68_06890 [Methanomicrobia archaeon]|nr:hypothetical protein [Methanomicrobia archaeon]